MSGLNPSLRRSGIVALVAVAVAVAVLPGVAAAQSGAGGTIVVESGETVSEVNAVGGAVIVHGTVTGDVSGAAGEVLITGTVEGDVNVAAGSLRISGHVGGDVSAGAGSIHLEDGGTVDGNFDAGAGEIRIDGAIGGDARLGAETIYLGETASIAGSLTYDGRLEGNRDAVAGDVTRDRTLGPTTPTELPPLASWVFAVYAFIANLLLGAVLLALFPRFSEGVAEQVTTEPLKTGLVGLGVIVAVPLLLVVLLITVVGIPLALVGMFLFVLLAWVGVVYGRFALGMWLLSLQGRERIAGIGRPWVALVLGLLLGGVLAAVPVVGWVVNLLLFLLGIGALAVGLYDRRWRTRERSPDAPSEELPVD